MVIDERKAFADALVRAEPVADERDVADVVTALDHDYWSPALVQRLLHACSKSLERQGYLVTYGIGAPPRPEVYGAKGIPPKAPEPGTPGGPLNVLTIEQGRRK